MPTLQEAEKEAREIVNKWSAGAIALSWLPGSTVILSGADGVMIGKVARAFGVKDYSSEAFLTSIGMGFAGKRLAGLALDFIPIAGWAVKAAVAASGTKALGEATIRYFRDQSPYKNAP